MVNILTRTTRAKWLAYLGATLLLVATLAQSAHFCGFQSFDLRDGTQLRADSPNTTLCLTCLMAQSVAAIVLSLSISAVFRRRLRVSPLRIRPRLFLEFFRLYVRPPPTF
jgi:hypothetical protein